MKQPAEIGLCATCHHLEIVTSARGSVFYLCRLAMSDSRFTKYPVVPVLACAGYTSMQVVIDDSSRDARRK